MNELVAKMIKETTSTAVDFWDTQPTDQPHYLNGFNGTWKFSDHSLIPGPLYNFILEAFHPQEKIKRIPLEEINKLMNEVWEGPGSMSKIIRLAGELRMARLEKTSSDTSRKETWETKTIDDFSEEEMTSKMPELDLGSDDEDE